MFHNVSKVVPCDKLNASARFPEDKFHFSWQPQHFGDLDLHFAWHAQHLRRVVWHDFVNRIVRAASSGDNVQIASQAWGMHSTLYT